MIGQAVAGAGPALVLLLLLVPRALLAHVAEVRVRIEFGGKGLLAAAPAGQQLALLGVPPLHASVLEPDFHLVREGQRAGQRPRLAQTPPQRWGLGAGHPAGCWGWEDSCVLPLLACPPSPDVGLSIKSPHPPLHSSPHPGPDGQGWGAESPEVGRVEEGAVPGSPEKAGSCMHSLPRPYFPLRNKGFQKIVRFLGEGELVKTGLWGKALTWESFKPSLAASFLRSGLLMYFCFWNIFSRALRCTSENTARRSMPRRGLPRAASGQEKVPGMGTTLEDAAGGGEGEERGAGGG